MSTVLCLDDFTCSLTEATHVLRANGYEVLAADENTRALELAAEKPLDAVILNCHRDRDNTGLVTALRILQPSAAIVLFSGYCGVPCHQLHIADACIQKGDTASALLPLLRAVVCQSRYEFCRSVPAGLRVAGRPKVPVRSTPVPCDRPAATTPSCAAGLR